jgi:2-dehydro-3-deoxyphosphogluconate aldolase/(4S)-4-hydroxy-2-oxoglutarate aldolase
MPQNILEQIGRFRIVPIVTIDRAAHAEPMADALIAGGLPLAEITLRTDAALEAIATLAKRADFLIGAGTILNIEMAKRAVDTGAKFLVTPGLNEKVVRYCVEQKIPITPGVATPTEIEMALDCGLNVVKFFPAESLGGLKTIKHLCGPYPMIRFMPTGGVGPENVGEYLKFSKIHACGGSWMASKELLAARQFERMKELAQQAVQMVRDAAGGGK